MSIKNEDYKPKHGWLDPLNRGIIKAAVKDRNSVVRLRDGRVFRLTYSTDRGFETVKLMPKHGFIPQGEFDVRRILDETANWVETEGQW